HAWFVCGKDLEKNELIVGQGHDSIYLESNWCIAADVNWICDTPLENHPYTAKFRYRQKDIPVTITFLENNKIRVDYPGLCRAVTPGQAVVLYDGMICLGGAIISEVYYNEERRKY
ncbi:MAG: tRNA 2-thiouridine(34) synthase MnmA, partial [Anaeroplasmataceae bacterium]|nr:tRNA 2-thiouridine(34) synthase MnmA [Anaeroplasmataceae bacterium]